MCSKQPSLVLREDLSNSDQTNISKLNKPARRSGSMIYIYIYSRLRIISRSIGPVMPEISKPIHKSRLVRMDIRSLKNRTNNNF